MQVLVLLAFPTEVQEIACCTGGYFGGSLYVPFMFHSLQELVPLCWNFPP